MAQGAIRSREGAWIEIARPHSATSHPCRSREGAWIEMSVAWSCGRQMCRSREGAWIEISRGLRPLARSGVAPARERGLKFA